MSRLFFAVVFLGVSSIPLCLQAMDRGEYYASVSSVQHGLAPEFRRLLSSCGAEASMIVNLQAAAESHGSLEDSLVRSFLGKSHFGQNVLYCLDARIERLESTDDLAR
jgi:hypothetical protein|tara:strand:- start:141 stop:464 length:324 start_codon:yes stop_codon:yes gene_type:complete